MARILRGTHASSPSGWRRRGRPSCTALTPEEREEIRREEKFYAGLLDRITNTRFLTGGGSKALALTSKRGGFDSVEPLLYLPAPFQ